MKCKKIKKNITIIVCHLNPLLPDNNRARLATEVSIGEFNIAVPF